MPTVEDFFSLGDIGVKTSITRFSRDESGRFTVTLLVEHPEPDLGDTNSITHKCFQYLESQLLRNPIFYTQCPEFLREYLNNGPLSQ